MSVMKSGGIYYTQGNAKNAVEGLRQYENVLSGLEPKVSFTSAETTVPSYHEQWMFYTISKVNPQ